MIPRIEIAPDYDISRILKGGWQLAGGHGPIDRQSAIQDMFKFVEAGITTFDFGDIYTGVEELVGEFVRRYGAGDVQLHTKYVPDLDTLPDVDKTYTERVVDRSLRRLGVDILDLVQFHWWDYSIPRYVDVAQHLVDLQGTGKIRHIGVTNFDTTHLGELVDAGIPVVSNQVQYSPLDRRSEQEMVEFCQQNGISLLCYGVVAGGFLSERYLEAEEPQEPLENRSLTKYKLIIDDFGGWELFEGVLEALEIVAQKHKVSIANVTIRYILDRPQVAGVIIGARNTDHLEDNLRVFSFELDNEDRMLLESVFSKSKGLEGDVYSIERDREGKHGRIMKYNLNKE